MFFVVENMTLLPCVYHAFHHDFTIEKPRSTTRISRNPPQNHRKNAEIHTPPAADIFPREKPPQSTNKMWLNVAKSGEKIAEINRPPTRNRTISPIIPILSYN